MKEVIKPLIVNRTLGTVQIWDAQKQEYYTVSFEVVKNILAVIQSKTNNEGVIYIE